MYGDQRIPAEHEWLGGIAHQATVLLRHRGAGEPRVQHGCDFVQLGDDPEQMMHLLGRGARHREPIDPEVRRVVLRVDRHRRVAVAPAVRCEPQRVEAEEHGALAGQPVTRELERDAEVLPVELVEDRGIPVDGKRHLAGLRRRAVRPHDDFLGSVLGIVVDVLDEDLLRRRVLDGRRRLFPALVVTVLDLGELVGVLLGVAIAIFGVVVLVDVRQPGPGLEEPRALHGGELREQRPLLLHAVFVARRCPRHAHDPHRLLEIFRQLGDECLGIGNHRSDLPDHLDKRRPIGRAAKLQHEERERRVAVARFEAVDSHQLPSWRACQSRNMALNSGHSRSCPRS